jgi:catechol 2,3-dioxygenase-like lactoylglutathione lyase family enzyme
MPLGHLGLNVLDLPRAKEYYDAVMPLLSYEPFLSGPDEFAYKPAWGKVGTYVFFYRSLHSGEYSRDRTGLQHLGFMVSSRDAVEAVHRAVIALGSDVLHEPREFPEYHPGYYATFWLDPFGQMLEAVCHKAPPEEVEPGDVRRRLPAGARP